MTRLHQSLAIGAFALASAGETLTVVERPLADRKIVFATVESVDVTRARARILYRAHRADHSGDLRAPA